MGSPEGFGKSGPWHEMRDGTHGTKGQWSKPASWRQLGLRGARYPSSHFAYVYRSDASEWAIPGMFGWKIGKTIRLQRPIPISGQLGVWTLPPAIRLCLAVHIRDQSASVAASGSAAPVYSSARVVADGKGVYLQHPARLSSVATGLGAAKEIEDGSAFGGSCCPKDRWQLSTETWLQLERRVSEALQEVKEREAVAAARRRAKAVRYHAARALLAPGIIVNVHQSWLDCEAPPSPELMGGVQVTGRSAPTRFGRRRPCTIPRGSCATTWRAVCLLRRRAGSGSVWLVADALDAPGHVHAAGAASNKCCFSAELSCGAFEKTWRLPTSAGILRSPAPTNPPYCADDVSSPGSSFLGFRD